MIAYLPTIYPDELVYSWIARYYCHTTPYYSTALDDLMKSKYTRPDIEYISSLNDETKQLLSKSISIQNLILHHTMFPYARFSNYERKTKALNMLIHQEECAHDLIPIPNSLNCHYLKYCPICAMKDKTQYGEAIWRRNNNIRNINICTEHKCKLKDTQIIITSKQSPKPFIAEETMIDFEPEYVSEHLLEYKFSKYVIEVFNAAIQLDSKIKINYFLVEKLEGTKYISARGNKKYVSQLYSDITDFYRNHIPTGKLSIQRIQKILSGNCIDFFDICQLGFFLNISSFELTHPIINDVPRSIRFNTEVEQLFCQGLSSRSIAKILKTSPSTILNANKEKEKRPHNYSVRKGMTKENWDDIDKELFKTVSEICEKTYFNEFNRPGRVTVPLICKTLKLPDKYFNHLPECKELILSYREEYPVFWAREIVWAYTKLEKEKDTVCWKHIRDLINIKKENYISAIPHFKQFADNDTVVKLLLIVNN